MSTAFQKFIMYAKASLILTVLTGLFSIQAVASPVFTPSLDQRCVSEGYATFYDDNACTQNGGQAVALNNAGCLANEIGRNSVYIQAPCVGSPSMVWSPGANCDCQDDCASVPTFDSDNGNGCWNLNGHAAASSFRFIEQDCGGNNC